MPLVFVSAWGSPARSVALKLGWQVIAYVWVNRLTIFSLLCGQTFHRIYQQSSDIQGDSDTGSAVVALSANRLRKTLPTRYTARNTVCTCNFVNVRERSHERHGVPGRRASVPTRAAFEAKSESRPEERRAGF
jgi:hypothetical protein